LYFLEHSGNSSNAIAVSRKKMIEGAIAASTSPMEIRNFISGGFGLSTKNGLQSTVSATCCIGWKQASEMIAAYTGKIGNALKKGGVV
jgi:hypothetical protein